MKTKSFMNALSAEDLRNVNGGFWEPIRPTILDIINGGGSKYPWDIVLEIPIYR